MHAPWNEAHYVVEERRLTLGRQYRILNNAGTQLSYVSQRWMRLKEAWTVYADESKSHVVMQIKATKVFDFQANLEIRDEQGNLLGSLRRKGWASMVADHWHVFDAAGKLVGELEESTGRGLARRMLSKLVPYRAHIRGEGSQVVARVEGRFQIWGDRYDVRIDWPSLDARVLCCLVVVVDSLSAERGSLLDLTGLGG